MAARYKRKFKNFFIKKDLQGRLSLLLFAAVAAGCIVFFVLLAFFSRDTLTFSYTDSVVQVGQTPLMIFKNALMANWLFLLIGGTCLVGLAIIGTHRVAGPLFRFERTLDSMNDGDLSDTIHLRGKDEGKDLANKINAFNQSLSDKLQVMERSSRAIRELLAQQQALEPERFNPDDVASILAAIQKHNDKIRTEVNSFTRIDE